MPIRYIDDEPEQPAATAPRVRYVDEEAPEPRTSQWLGFREGLQTVAENVEPVLSVLPYFAPYAMQRQHMNELNRQAIEQEKGQGVEGGDAGRFAGKLVGSAPLAMMPGVGPAVGGGLMGYAGSEGDTLQDKAVDTGLGAAGGKIGGAIISKVADAVAPVISPAVRHLTERGVQLTPGQMRGGAALANEDRLMSQPFVGNAIAQGRQKFNETFNLAAVNEALAPLGVKVPAGAAAGNDAVAFAQDVVSQAYERIVPQLAIRADARLAVGLRDVYTNVVAKLPETQQKQFQAIVDGVKFGQNGELAGRQLQVAVSDLGQLARTYSASATAAERELGKAVMGVKSTLDDLMVRQNPDAAPVLKATNDAWRRLTVVEDAAARADDGLASTAQVRDAARRSDGTRRKKATAAGRAGPMQEFAQAGRSVAAKIPNSGTADRVAVWNPVANALGGVALAGYRAGEQWGNALTKLSPQIVETTRNALTGLRLPATMGGASLAGGGRK